MAPVITDSDVKVSGSVQRSLISCEVLSNTAQLMLAIIGSAEMIKTDNQKLAAIIGNGALSITSQPSTLRPLTQSGTTANAIRQRVSKIKNQAKAVLEGTGDDIIFGGGAKAKGTPKKVAKSGAANDVDDDGEESTAPATTPKKRAANGKSKGTPRGKKAKDEVKDDVKEGDVDEGNEGASPTKRVKSEDSGDV